MAIPLAVRYEIELDYMAKLRFALLVCLTLLSNLTCASFQKDLWPQWEVHNPLSQGIISHQPWQDFLDNHVTTNQEGINLIDYAHLTKADIAQLSHYVTDLSNVNINHYNRHEQLAFWINLYNAITVLTVAHYYPISSIQAISISPGLFSIGPWGAHLIIINKTSLSLDDIDNRIIRPIWNDPRTHYALNNGTIGAPNLSRHSYHGDTLDEQLNNAATTYINSLRGTHIVDGKLIVSKIYEWYLEDFGGTVADLILHLSEFAKPPLRAQLKQINNINSYIYNWHLNSSPRE